MSNRPVDDYPKLPVDPDAPDERLGPRPLPLRWDAVALVFVGGFVGTLVRYGLAQLEPTPPRGWPWGTFVANIVGAFILGGLLEWLARAGSDNGWRQRARLLIGTGFCGAVTTYSTLAVEADLLYRTHDEALAVGYLAASLALGLLATIVGIAVATGHHRLRQQVASA